MKGKVCIYFKHKFCNPKECKSAGKSVCGRKK